MGDKVQASGGVGKLALDQVAVKDSSVTLLSHKKQTRLVLAAVFGLGIVLLGGGFALWWIHGETVFTALVSAALAWCF
jgi:hypothetical protein